MSRRIPQSYGLYLLRGELLGSPHPPEAKADPFVACPRRAQLWFSVDPFKDMWDQALNTSQPFVTSQGDPTGYSLHGTSLFALASALVRRSVAEILLIHRADPTSFLML